ncbi:AraC family transcriptional regulator [Actinospongicola halichondriae]|uniref:helix-turn-helix domain-containing protein n=1 Tax=Actinospongicola halichondriae TaxID=3236844 RepID=UPI003D3FCA9D
MVESRHLADRDPVAIEYSPHRRHPKLPVEVVDRSSILERTRDRELGYRQRVGFHLLIVCTAGQGSHVVDFEPVQVSEGTCLRVRPGQVQRFVPDPAFDARMVVWPTDSHPTDPEAPVWFPGCDATSKWQLEGESLDKALHSVRELEYEQDRFDGSPRNIALMSALLSALLLRLALEIPESVPESSRLPQPYLDFRAVVERRLYERPTVVDLARELGYSTRTLDRACRQAAGQTAKEVFDDRVALEIRRLLTHTDRSIASVGAEFGFHDPSNFSKFVKRHLGGLPGDIRDRR